MRIGLVIIIVSLCNVLSSFAQQSNDYKERYALFKRQVMNDYDDFRKKVNDKYAEFMRQAWNEFHALPQIPKPKNETVPPVVLQDEDKDKPVDSSPVPQ